jgi:hypothetical protein
LEWFSNFVIRFRNVSLNAPVMPFRCFPIDISISGSALYDNGKWTSGMFQNISGTQRCNWVGISPTMQVKFNRWKFQPTFEAGWRREYLDFSDWEQLANTRPWSIIFPLMKPGALDARFVTLCVLMAQFPLMKTRKRHK